MTTKTYEEVVLEDAPEIFLRLAETSGTDAADATRFGRDFTHSGSPTLDQDGPEGIGGKAVSYDGSNDHTVYNTNIPITGYPFSVEGWLKSPGTTATSTNYCFVSGGNGGTNTDGFFIALQPDGSNNLRVRILTYASSTATSTYAFVPNSLKGEFIHVVGVWVSSTERHIYANGVLLTTDTSSRGFPSGMTNFSVGADARGTFGSGVIAEPAYYNYALSEERIRIHHAVGRGYTDTGSYGYAAMVEGPSLYATLGDASGNAVDSSGWKRDLTVAGAPTRGATGPLSEAGGDDATTFDGSDDAFALSGDDLDITAYPLTLVMFGKTPAGPANSTSYARLMFGDDGTEDNYFGLDLTTDGSGNPQARGLLETGGTADHTPGAPLLAADQFYMIVWRLVSATERHLEINGVLQETGTTSRAFGSNINDVVIGRDLAAAPTFYAGTQGQVLIYGHDIGAAASQNLYAKAKQYLGDDHRTKTLAKCPSAYYRLGESSGTTASDETEFGRDGTYAGTVTLEEDGALVGDADTAALYDGTDGQLTYSEAFITQYPVTLEALVKLPATPSSSTSYIRVGITDASGTMKMVAGLKTDANTKIQAHIAEVGSATGSADNSCGGAVGNFHHLVAEFVSDTSRKIWLNGVELEEETTSTSVTLSNLDTICVGVEDLGTDAWYAGYCDEFALYQRQLSPAEIRDQYLSGLGYFANPVLGIDDAGWIQQILGDAPSLFLPLNEIAGSTAADASRWGRDGTYSGGVTLDSAGPIPNLAAISLDGADDKVEYLDVNDQPLTGFPATLVFWAKSPSTLANSTAYTFFGIGDTATTNDDVVLQLHTDGSGNVFVRAETHQGGGADKEIDQNSGTGIATQNNKFLHCALVLRSATDRELYVQGRSAGTDTNSSSFPSNMDAVRIGQYTDSGGAFSEGFACGAALFPYELTEAQMLGQFMAGRGVFAANDPYLYEVGQRAPAVHYRLNEDSGNPSDLLGLRDLAIAGSPTLGADGPIYNADDDAAITLDGTDDAATLADDAQVAAYPTAYVGWIATPASPGTSDVFGQMGMADDGTGSNVLAIGLKTDGSSNVTPAGYLSTGGTADNAEPTSPVLEAAVFHHIIWVQRSATDRELYVNGASVATDTTSRTFPSNLDDILLGRTAGSVFREGTIAEFSILTSDVSDSEALDLYLAAFKAKLFFITVYQQSIADTVSVQDQIALAFFHSMVDTIQVSDQIKLAWIQSLSDSVGLSETIEAVMTFVNAVSDSVNVADSINNILKAIALAEDTVEMSEVINARGVFIRSLSDSIETSITINVSGVEYVGLVLNTANMAISTYQGWDFNSFAEIDGHYIGAGREGVYELGGEDDDGTDIEWEIDLGNIDFGNSQDKRLPEIFYACRSDGTILFKVTHVKDDGAKVENWYQATRTSDALTERRVKLKKGVKSQYYRVEIMGKDGSSVDLEKIELTPMVLQRKL